jgi:hypothetical protein
MRLFNVLQASMTDEPGLSNTYNAGVVVWSSMTVYCRQRSTIEAADSPSTLRGRCSDLGFASFMPLYQAITTQRNFVFPLTSPE